MIPQSLELNAGPCEIVGGPPEVKMIGRQGGDGGQLLPVEFFGLPKSIVHLEEEGVEGCFEFDYSAIASGFQIAGDPFLGEHTGMLVAKSACPERDAILSFRR